METLEQVLRRHAQKYPLMEPVDAVKLIYQNVFGGGYLIRDPEAFRNALRREYENTPQQPQGVLLESIGNGMVRVMLNAVDSSDYSIAWVGDAFIRSSQEHTGSLNGLLLKLDILRKVTASGAFRFTLEELETYLDAYRQAGYPMVSHSNQYREAYRPAYRIALANYFTKEIP